MKSVNIQYFALLREQAKTEQEQLDMDCRTYGDVYKLLQEKHGFTLPLEIIQVAVNDEFAPLSQEVLDGAKIVFIPPVAGG